MTNSTRTPRAPEELVNALYDELRKRAARMVHQNRVPVAPSSLVHEVLIRLWKADSDRWESERHFRAVAASAMRQVLIDRVRSHDAQKRGGGLQRVDLSDLMFECNTVDVIALGQALERLSNLRARCAAVVELRLLGGLSSNDAAEQLGLSESTVKREWRAGRAWLISELDLVEEG